MKNLDFEVDIDATTALHIAAGMRKVSEADGIHPQEQALIDQFVSDLPGTQPDEPDLSRFETDELKDLFLKSTALVALADGSLSEAEMVPLREYARRLGRTEAELDAVIHEVGRSLLAHFQGVQHFRDQVESIGRDLGLEDEDIEQALEE